MYSLSIGEGWYAGRPIPAASTPSKPRSRRSSASTNTSTARTGLLSSTQSSRHSGSNVACPRSSPATKPGIKSPADSVGDHGMGRVFTQPWSRTEVKQYSHDVRLALTSGHAWCSRIVTSGSFPKTNHTPTHEGSTFSRLGPIPKFVQSNAELPFAIERGELRGSGTLINSATKVFHDVTRGAAL